MFVNRQQLALSYAKSKKEAKRQAAEEATLAMMAYEKVTRNRAVKAAGIWRHLIHQFIV